MSGLFRIWDQIQRVRVRGHRAWGLVCGLMLLGAATPARAFEIEIATISPKEVVIPCPGAADVWVAVGGTLGNADIVAGQIACTLVVQGLFVDDALAPLRFPLRGGDAAGSYVTRVVKVTVRCDAQCRLILADGTAGPGSASVAVECATGGRNYGSGTISCKKNAPKVGGIVESRTRVAAGEPLDYSVVFHALNPADARRLRGSATLQLTRFGSTPPQMQVLQQIPFENLIGGFTLNSALPTTGLPPGVYRLVIGVVDRSNRPQGQIIHAFEVMQQQ